ncbi:MAG: tRNA (N6-isopentenyl adenosine(37)-C2)-methylthiotransferase MiaB [Vicinamibacteria bacterium]|nr:tRNA (N6-isopentenyl adenosine(37)-C2)-methylthiotransferase MiaB [Vicinamibacteria bacterium]
MTQRYFIETFGCQMNVNDSEKVAGLLRREGYEEATSVDQADVVFVNTCAVREKASEKLYHSLGRFRRIKKQRPELRVSVGGCVAQLQGKEILDRAPGVDVVIGTHNLSSLPELLERSRDSSEPLLELDRKADAFAVEAVDVVHSNRVRAFVTVMEGCNHVCSFCVVPRTRGPEVNRTPGEILREVRHVVEQGFAEVMLLGQTVNAYASDGIDFAELLHRVHEVSGLRRLRFTTSHPEHVNKDLARAFRELPKLGGYLHLPVQSGAPRVLADMRRGYTPAEYLEKVALLRAHRPDLALSTDVIVGYPGETEEEFEDTLRLVGQVGFESIFSFMYSPRPGTTAFRQVDDVPEEEKRHRLHTLQRMQQRFQEERNRGRVGEQETILVDTIDGPGRVSGRTMHFRLVHVDGEAELLGREVAVRIDSAGPNAFRGSRVEDSALETSA